MPGHRRSLEERGMQDQPQAKSLHEVAAATRYPIDAFHFVRRGLDFTVHHIHENPELLDEAERHVSGQQLCRGLRDFAVAEYGLLARAILARWNIHRTEDFGHIVFAMVDGGLMQKTEEDSLRDFADGFDFDSAFDAPISVESVELEDAARDVHSDDKL
jgi:uncharacterized repeat protein (TIGR04138 family)